MDARCEPSSDRIKADWRHVKGVYHGEVCLDVDLGRVGDLAIVVVLSSVVPQISLRRYEKGNGLTPTCRFSYAFFNAVNDTRDDDSDKQYHIQ